MSVAIVRAVLHEAFKGRRADRIPETELVMNASQTVADYSSCGDQDGALYGPYLYNALQVSARLKEGDKVIDLGCGSGRLLNIIAQWNPAVEFIGVDLAPAMLDAARQQASKLGLGNVTYRSGDFSTLDEFETSSADAVISSMALHHLPDRSALTRCFSAIGRVLRADGTLYLMDFGRLRSMEAIEVFVSLVARTESTALSEDYRASLKAAFLPTDFADEVVKLDRVGIELHRTIIAPLVIVVSTPLPSTPLRPSVVTAYRRAVQTLSRSRQSELNQLRLFLKLGGLAAPL